MEPVVNFSLGIISVTGSACSTAPVISVSIIQMLVKSSHADRNARRRIGHRQAIRLNRDGLIIFHTIAAAVRVRGFKKTRRSGPALREGVGPVGRDQRSNRWAKNTNKKIVRYNSLFFQYWTANDLRGQTNLVSYAAKHPFIKISRQCIRTGR